MQEELFFSIACYLGLRGREWINGLREHIKIKVDSRGRKCVILEGIDSIQKNNQPRVENAQSSQSVKEGRIYSVEGVPDRCPVRCFEVYLEKLSANCDRVFYQSLRNWATSPEWYNPKLPMGVNTIANLMQRISKEAGLSQVYSSHCIRPTVVTNMFNQSLQAEDIQNITGHKNKNSVERYMKHVSDDKKMEYSTALTRGFLNQDLPTTSNDLESTKLSELIIIQINSTYNHFHLLLIH